jgi:hypothetical protein
MSLNVELSKIPLANLVLAILVIIGILGPGYLLIYTLTPELFLELDSFKLTVLAVGLTTPVLIINALCSVLVVDVNEERTVDSKPESEHAGFFSSTIVDHALEATLGTVIVSPLVMYLTLLACYIWHPKPSIGVLLLAVFQSLALLCFWIAWKFNTNQNS